MERQAKELNMKSNKTLIDAIYVNNSGGKVLLDYLIQSCHQLNRSFFYLLDERCRGDYDYLNPDEVVYLSASLRSRHQFYTKNKAEFTGVFCFGNIPPTIRLDVKVVTYFHNVLLLNTPSSYPIKAKISTGLKKLFLKYFLKNTDYLAVQSGAVQEMVIRNTSINVKNCLILPFYDEQRFAGINMEKDNQAYFYISNANPHKNHLNLLKAWELIHAEDPTLKLELTVAQDYDTVIGEIERLQGKGVSIVNHGFTNIENIIGRAGYIIYPSLTESFGLGLIEGVNAGCEVLAADLPYVHEVIKPLAVFDPLDPTSIARCVLESRNTRTKSCSSLVIENKVDQLFQKL